MCSLGGEIDKIRNSRWARWIECLGRLGTGAKVTKTDVIKPGGTLMEESKRMRMEWNGHKRDWLVCKFGMRMRKEINWSSCIRNRNFRGLDQNSFVGRSPAFHAQSRYCSVSFLRCKVHVSVARTTLLLLAFWLALIHRFPLHLFQSCQPPPDFVQQITPSSIRTAVRADCCVVSGLSRTQKIDRVWAGEIESKQHWKRAQIAFRNCEWS